MVVIPSPVVETMAMRGEEFMSQIATKTWGRPWRRPLSAGFVALAIMLLATPKYTAQVLRKGVSVELAPTQHAVALPDADNGDALIVAVTHSGTVYLGIDPIAPAALSEKHDLFSRAGDKLYIKADARTPYANVSKVLDAVRTAGVTAPNLLTGQHETPVPGKLVLPKGLEVRIGTPLPAGAGSTVVQVLYSGQQWPKLKINNQDIPWANLESSLTKLLTNRSEKIIVVKADGQLPYGNVVHVIDACRSAGAKVFLAPVFVPTPVA